MTDPGESITIENVVGSTAIDQELDLQVLSEDLEEVSYDPDIFPGLVYRSVDPKASGLLFRSGKMVFTGGRSVDELEQAAGQTFEALSELGLKVPETPELTIQNIVTSGDLGTPLNLSAIAVGLGLENIEYEPEQFPGLVYRLPDVGVVALLFGSGKVVITGGAQPEDAETAIQTIHSELSDLQLLEEISGP